MRFWIILFVALIILNLVATFYSTCHAMECKSIDIDKLKVKKQNITWNTVGYYEETFKINDEYEVKGYSCYKTTCYILLCKKESKKEGK